MLVDFFPFFLLSLPTPIGHLIPSRLTGLHDLKKRGQKKGKSETSSGFSAQDRIETVRGIFPDFHFQPEATLFQISTID